MEDWKEFSFCHYNDYRNVVEAWTRDPEIIIQRVSFLVILLDGNLDIPLDIPLNIPLDGPLKSHKKAYLWVIKHNPFVILLDGSLDSPLYIPLQCTGWPIKIPTRKPYLLDYKT